MRSKVGEKKEAGILRRDQDEEDRIDGSNLKEDE